MIVILLFGLVVVLVDGCLMNFWSMVGVCVNGFDFDDDFIVGELGVDDMFCDVWGGINLFVGYFEDFDCDGVVE